MTGCSCLKNELWVMVLQKAIAKVAADPEVIERFKLQGVEIRSSTPEEFKALRAKVDLINEKVIRIEARFDE